MDPNATVRLINEAVHESRHAAIGRNRIDQMEIAAGHVSDLVGWLDAKGFASTEELSPAARRLYPLLARRLDRLQRTAPFAPASVPA